LYVFLIYAFMLQEGAGSNSPVFASGGKESGRCNQPNPVEPHQGAVNSRLGILRSFNVSQIDLGARSECGLVRQRLPLCPLQVKRNRYIVVYSQPKYERQRPVPPHPCIFHVTLQLDIPTFLVLRDRPSSFDASTLFRMRP